MLTEHVYSVITSRLFLCFLILPILFPCKCIISFLLLSFGSFFFINAEHRNLPAFLFYIFNAQGQVSFIDFLFFINAEHGNCLPFFSTILCTMTSQLYCDIAGKTLLASISQSRVKVKHSALITWC
uniref:Uncharacterized protein n=1 Tax=Rhipicephalus microplus TaxID=6941 RepID=A0A6G5A427_RHIMP